jgi:hypothetical protein
VLLSEGCEGAGGYVAIAFYRLVKNNPPHRQDFISNQEKRGQPRSALPSHLKPLWSGISLHQTEAQSRRQAAELPRLGKYLAELQIPDDAAQSIRWERTIPHNDGHFTLWGDADSLLACVVRVIAIEEPSHAHEL